MRKEVLSTGHHYHLLNRSIAGFRIFNNKKEYQRMLETIIYYQYQNQPARLSRFLEYSGMKKEKILANRSPSDKLVIFTSYCLMPTHFHLIVKQLKNNSISHFMANVENSFTRYFNTKHKRKGPLWEARFKSVLIRTDEQLLHLTRYLHLNPTSAGLINSPQDWPYSSYREYLKRRGLSRDICEFKNIIDMPPGTYRRFVEERIDFQRELSKIKKLLIENYTGLSL